MSLSLADYGFHLPRRGVATTAGAAAALAAEIGFPVALKIISPDIPHKTDVGGVALGLTDRPAVEAACAKMLREVAARAPAARLEGVAVEQMVAGGGVEIIIGLTNDPQFGPALMLGLGGIFAEALGDVTFRLLPLRERDARAMLAELRGRRLLEGFRGAAPVSQDMLVGLLLQAARLGEDLGGRLDSVDLNPVLVRGDHHWVLDAKVVLRDVPAPASTAQPNTAHLAGFFQARAVAVVGASATPGKIGQAVMDSLAGGEYRGAIYPINPSRPEVLGYPAYPSLSATPPGVELVVVTVGLSTTPDILRDCAALGIHNVVIISGGGKELGGRAEEVEAEIKALAGQHGIRVVGPNCIGVFDGETRLDTFFQVRQRMLRPKAGPIAIIVQSGTVGAAVLEAIDSVGVSRFVSYGNRVDVDEADLTAYLAGDPTTQVIACYLEGLADGRKFFRVASQVSPAKPIVVFKSGRTPRAARASISHTGFFGGTYGVAAGAFRQAGCIAVDSIEELSAVSRALALQPPARGGRIAMISNGAGSMVQAMDLMEGYGLNLAAPAEATLARLRAAYPPFYVVQNPVDVTGSATSTDYEIGVAALMDDPNVDIVMPWFVFQDTPLGEDIVEKLGRLSARRIKPLLCGGMGGPYTARMARALEEAGVPCLGSVREWVAAAGALAQRGRYLSEWQEK